MDWRENDRIINYVLFRWKTPIHSAPPVVILRDDVSPAKNPALVESEMKFKDLRDKISHIEADVLELTEKNAEQKSEIERLKKSESRSVPPPKSDGWKSPRHEPEPVGYHTWSNSFNPFPAHTVEIKSRDSEDHPGYPPDYPKPYDP
jgi:hypothetical protein